MPLVYDDIYEITRDSSELILWLQDRGIIGNFSRDRVRCFEGRITLKKDSSYGRDGFVWRCTKKECGYKISVRAGSWFENSHLTLQQNTVDKNCLRGWRTAGVNLSCDRYCMSISEPA